MPVAEPWVELFHADPRPWILRSEEAPARWVALTASEDEVQDDEVGAARAEAVASPMVQELIARLAPWDEYVGVSGHASPAYQPNLLHLLADMGVRGGDDGRVEAAVDDFCAHQDGDGRFLAFGRAPGHPDPIWRSLPCDTHIITEVLIRYGRGDHPATRRGLERVAADLRATNQGEGWTCIPDPAVGFRGPGRIGDICPRVTLEALRVFSHLPVFERPDGLDVAARTMLRLWEKRHGQRPYMFGHGDRFKTVKWPAFWYGILWMLDTLGRYPGVWQEGPEGRQTLAEMLGCLVAYNLSSDGTVTPRSVYRGFELYSYGQKKQPSPFATALTMVVVLRLAELAGEAMLVDVAGLSEGHVRTVRPGGSPRRGSRQDSA